MNGDRVVGRMHRDLLAWDVKAYLNNVRLWFDVKGFLRHTVDVHQWIGEEDKIIGQIAFTWGRTAELQLTSGEKYLWQRQNFLMHEWSLLREDDQKREVIHYDQTRAFLADEGEIELLQSSPNMEVLILSGLFVRNYFLRKRRMAAAS